MKIYIAIILISILLTSTLDAQSVYASGGQSIGLLSYTIGEPLTSTLEVTNIKLSQGFQQTRLTIVSVKHISNDIEVDIFPNPADYIFTISIKGHASPIQVSIYDLQGKLQLEYNEVLSGSSLSVSSLAVGSYLIITKTKENQAISHHKFSKF
jgi:Secretion system C-terminal sorting domain